MLDYNGSSCLVFSGFILLIEFNFSILAPKMEFEEQEQMKESSRSLLNLFSPYDLKRLDAYTNRCADFPMVI